MSPLWPKANGEVEHFMRNFWKGTTHNYLVEGRYGSVPCQLLPIVLRVFFPATALFRGPVRTKLPNPVVVPSGKSCDPAIMCHIGAQ